MGSAYIVDDILFDDEGIRDIGGGFSPSFNGPSSGLGNGMAIKDGTC